MSDEAIYKNAPLYRALAEYIEGGAARFHMPGHKGAAVPPLGGIFGGCLPFDVTELPGTDSLFDACGPIREAETLAAREFGAAATLFSAGGASLCIQAMLRLASFRSKTVICARNLHHSAVNALCLLGLSPVWVWPRRFEGSSLPGRVLPADVERALRRHPEAAAVFVTSPDYYGVLSDIAGISAVCKKQGALLLVDGSHGGHLHFVPGPALHPLRLGADLCCDSAHKTLPVLTGGAYLQLGGTEFTAEEAKSAMALFGSTSPSYLIMLSLDLARSYLHLCGRAAFSELCGRVERLREIARDIGFFAPSEARLDPARLTLDFASAGVSGGEAARRLREAGISPEMEDDRHVVLLPSPLNPPEDFLRVERFLLSFRPETSLPLAEDDPERPEAPLSPREACLAPQETLPAERAAGRVSAESKCPCPPGVPLVMPGERISPSMAARLKKYGVFRINVIK